MMPSLTAAEVAALVGGEIFHGPAERPISGANSLEQATPTDAAFFGNARYLPALRRTRAGVVLVPVDFDTAGMAADDPLRAATLIQVENPTLAFSKLVEKFAPPAPSHAPGVAPSAVVGRDVKLGAGVSIQPQAVIEEGAEIGDRTVIGAGCFVGQGVVIGEDCQLHPRVVLREGTILGRRVIIQPGAVIGGDGFGFQLHAGRHIKIPQLGGVRIDDDVEIGANTTIDRARFGYTHIGEGTKIDNLVMLAHNVSTGPHCLIVAQAGVSGSTRLGKYVTLAGQAGIVGHIEIGDRAVIAAKSGASKDVPPDSVLFGMIGEPIQQARANLVNVRRLPKLLEKMKKLEAELAELKTLAAETGGGRRLFGNPDADAASVEA